MDSGVVNARIEGTRVYVFNTGTHVLCHTRVGMTTPVHSTVIYTIFYVTLVNFEIVQDKF